MNKPAASRGLIAFTVMLPTLIEIIDTSIVNVSLDHIRGSLSAGYDESTWTITAYLVSNAIVIPMASWFARLIGRKNYQIASIALFTFSSFMCGSAWSLNSLVFFRVLQGIGGGGLVPISQSILLETFPREKHGQAMAIFGMGAMLGPIVGPLLGGWITDTWSWRWIFYINIPIGILSIVMNVLVIEDPPYMQRRKMKIDTWGLIFLTVGLGSLQFILDKGESEDWFDSRMIAGFAVVSAIALTLLVINEYYAENPVVNLKLLKDRTFTSGSVVMFFVFLNLFGSIVLLPIYLQMMMGYTSFHAGLVLGPGGSVGIAFTTTILARRAQLHQTRLVEQLSPFDPSYQAARERIGEALALKGLPAAGADSVLYRELVRQSTTLAFADAFLIICLLILCMLPLVLLMRRAPAQTGPPPAH